MSEQSSGMVVFVNPDAEDMLTLPMCTGNACENLGVRPVYEGNYISSFFVNNSGSKAVVVSIEWATLFGNCNTSTSDVVFPGATIEMKSPGPINVGYCGITANIQ